MEFRKYRDAAEATRHLRKHSGPGFSTLSILVQEQLNLSEGEFFVITPESLDLKTVSRLDNETPDIDHISAIRALSDTVRRFTMAPIHTVLLQDFVNQPADPGWDEYEFRDQATLFGSEVYWEIKGSALSPDRVERLIAHWSSYFPVLAFFCETQSSERKMSLTQEDLKGLANHVIALAADIFDGDSFLVWCRKDNLSVLGLKA